MSRDYSYIDSGFDSFLSRSIDDGQVDLDAQSPTSTAIRYDSAQVSGSLGNILRIGNIELNGVDGRISIYDDSDKETTRLGNLDD